MTFFCEMDRIVICDWQKKRKTILCKLQLEIGSIQFNARSGNIPKNTPAGITLGEATMHILILIVINIGL